MNEIQPVIEHLIGTYNRGPTNLSGLAGLDYGYFVRAAILIMSIYLIFSMLKLILSVIFRGTK